MIKTILIAFALFATTVNAEYWEEPVDYTQFTMNVDDVPAIETIICKVDWTNEEEVQAEVDAYNESNGYF